MAFTSTTLFSKQFQCSDVAMPIMPTMPTVSTMSTTPKRSKYFSDLLSTAVEGNEDGNNTPTVMEKQSRLKWEREKALSLGICDFVACEFDGMKMYSVTRLARIYGHESPNAFVKQWNMIKSDFQHCSEFRVFQKRGEDFVSRSTFDQAVLPFLDNQCANTVIEQLRKEDNVAVGSTELSQEPIQERAAELPSSTDVIRLARPEQPALPLWEITRDIWTRHDAIFGEMRWSRGCYIGQINQKEYKFGYTDKGFLTRTDNHTKDFKDFYLCFAHYCANGYEAERMFKANPFIDAHLIKLKTQKQNHREIIRIDASLSEERMKQIYLQCITKVNRNEYRTLKSMNEQTTTETCTVSSPEEENQDTQETNETRDTQETPENQEIIEVDENDVNQSDPDATETEHVEQEVEHITQPPKDTIPCSEAVELRKLDIIALRENHRHEIQLKILDHQKWVAFLGVQHLGFRVSQKSDLRDKKTERPMESRESKTETPKRISKRLSKPTKQVKILKVNESTQCIIGRYPSISAAVRSGKYDYESLAMSIKKGTVYKGHRWRVDS